MEKYTKAKNSALIYRLYDRGWHAFVYTLLLAIPIFFIVLIITGANFGLTINWLFKVSLIVLILQLIYAFLGAYLEYHNLGYIITDQGIKSREGILSINHSTIPFSKVTNADFSQSFIQRLFGVGDLLVGIQDENREKDEPAEGLYSIDSENGHKILTAISNKSNIQPITQK